MNGIKVRGSNLVLAMGKLPGYKQECFFFVEEDKNVITPVAFITERNLPMAQKLWGKMLENLRKEGG